MLTNSARRFRRYYDKGFETIIFKDRENYEKCVELYAPYKGTDANYFAKTGAIDSALLEECNKTRLMTQKELELCQTVPVGYTSMLDYEEAANVLGDG